MSSLENAFRVVDITHDLYQALKFRKFWGEKAELRRYKDGTIAESTGEVFLHASYWLLVIKFS